MEGMMAQRITPLLKCVVLFLFIFTAKVFTSRPNESHDTQNGIHSVKQPHYVRTFTKYHHRRTIQWNKKHDFNYWPSHHEQAKRSINPSTYPYIDYEDYYSPNVIKKRSIPNSNIKNRPARLRRNAEPNEYINRDLVSSDQFSSDSVKSNNVESSEKKVIKSNEKYDGKNKVSNEVHVKPLKLKANSTDGPSIYCLYKMSDSGVRSMTPSENDEIGSQVIVESDGFNSGPIVNRTHPDGSSDLVIKCTDPRASCFTLWRRDELGNVTVQGQGCWKIAGRHTCNKCNAVTKRLPASTVFCCCTSSYCNADFLSQKVETVTMKSESKIDPTLQNNQLSQYCAIGTLAALVLLLAAVLVHKLYCSPRAAPPAEGEGEEKGDVMGSGPEGLATGLLCVDNLSLIEHIGQGKFGSVWRGSLGSNPVAVKLYSNAGAWQKEVAIYTLPHLAHPNILTYYGSDSRPSLDGRRSHLVVLELCPVALRWRLQSGPLTWQELATLAHGLAAALAHLHTPVGNKPVIVHRDVNSNNVLISKSGDARLADLGLAQMILPRREHAPTTITEAGTLRYLAPEALEGALDLSGARAALCAVDVFALGLVLWEMLWVTRGAHAGPTPAYAAPYHHHGLPHKHTLAQMQSLVSRNKARPPLPKGPVVEARVLKLMSETCDECWDHDAEARLTAVCVEERMSELKQMLSIHPPLIHDNNLYPNASAESAPPPAEDKNSNCTRCDVTTPLLNPFHTPAPVLYPPHVGRNACIERNTHPPPPAQPLIHKSLKDIIETWDPPPAETPLSVARRVPPPEHGAEVRSYQRPLEYVPNDVSSTDIERAPKQTNILQDFKEKPKSGIRRFFERLNRNKMETEVKLAPENSQKTRTTIVEKHYNMGDRPSNLTVSRAPYNFEAPCLSPPNKTLSPTMMLESDNKVFKELPSRESDAKTPNQIFAVIVPKARPTDYSLELRSKSRGSSESINKRSVRTSMSSQSMFKSNSESEDSTVKKRLSCDNKIITNSHSGGSSRASINLELQYIDNRDTYNGQVSPFDLNSDCSSSEDEHLMLLSENGGSKITMQTISKDPEKKKQQDVLKEASQAKTDFGFNKFQNKYKNFENECSDPNDKENLVNGYSGDNPVYLAALNGELDTSNVKLVNGDSDVKSPRSPKPCLKNLAIKRQHSLEQVSEIFSSSGGVNLLNPAGRVKTPGDLPVAVRRARRDRALQKGRANECNRLSLYDDRMMFGNSL